MILNSCVRFCGYVSIYEARICNLKRWSACPLPERDAVEQKKKLSFNIDGTWSL